MRLIQIKLAGFKSFVDPTVVHIPGRRVGVVGPNGCGKSNIIDAVRWVLGESRAAALRGDSMQDVIFNGSTLRQPVARASVELVFDNSLGKAAGPWSQYAEISVKRVIERNGESAYFINNTHVRRRDVQDIFLGTGLGPRAYAIIEQGTISRIIEAKPEDLRVFLEEAAGVSKYKERRRETELRLADTRENLARVNDIRQELEAQIEKLTRQAEVARRYHELSAERAHKQNLLALLRRNEAQAEAQRHARDIAQSTSALEAETARLREIERRLEELRAEHYAAGDATSAAQGEMYAANAEVSQLEAQLRFVGDTRQRIEAQMAQLRAQIASGEQQRIELQESLRLWRERLATARSGAENARRKLAEEQAKFPHAEQSLRLLQGRLAGERERIAQAEQELHVEQAHLAHANRVLQGLEAREERLLAERTELAAPDPAEIERLTRELAQSSTEIERQRRLLARLEGIRAELDAARRQAMERQQATEREFSALDGRLLTLQKIQSQAEENAQIQDWIERHGLASRPRLWQRLKVEPGWEAAVESALRERLHALELSDPETLQRLLADPPPAKVSTFSTAPPAELALAAGLQPLASYVRAADAGTQAVVDAWLAPYYAVEETPRLMMRLGLSPQVILVTRDGHQFSRYGVAFHAPDPADTGILARQREIEALAAEAKRLEEAIASGRLALAQLDRRLAEQDEALAQCRAAGAALGQRHHELQLEQLRLSQGRERFEERSAQIEKELAEIAAQKNQEERTRAQTEQRIERKQSEINALYERLEAVERDYRTAEEQLESRRRSLQQAEREAQEIAFSEKECTQKINEIERQSQVLNETIRGATEALEKARVELGGLQDATLRDRLQQALSLKVEREQALSAARDRAEAAARALRQAEEERLACEQKLQPLRDRIAELRLKEQAAHINAEQFAQQLREASADEAALAASLKEGQRAASLQGEITRLGNAIAELGAVNMAALDELAASQERKRFLDAQATDLTAALDTLENAIRKIDRETRELLRTTFEEVNRHFGRLFPALFGGGEAQLIMTGEEILDCGVQVTARPPGKKNTTIHLLSGGEKALAAIALVFSFFHLNPAPFCMLDEVDAPLDDANVERFCDLVRRMSEQTQFLFISHNKVTMEMAEQLIGVTMQEQGVSRVVAVDIEEALKLREETAAASA